MDIPLALRDGDYNSVKSKGQLINLICETNKTGDYITVKRVDGLTSFTTSPNSAPIRSNFHKNGDYIYYVAGTKLYRFSTGAPTDMGTVGGSGRATVISNAVPGNNQVLVLNGEGLGYIHDNSGLTQITDVDFFPTTSVAVLNERFWFSRDDTNEFFCSAISDGFTYDPLAFGTAEWKPDNVEVLVSKKSALWVLGQKTAEYNQSYDDIIFPVRAVRGASLDIGILANNSFAELNEYFCFLGSDSNVYMIVGTEAKIISDLEFAIKIRGDGTLQNPGFTSMQIQSCIGFFVDTPQHKIYYLSFPTANYTWGFDINTGLPHTRQSADEIAWRGLYSITDENTVYVGDRLTSTIWKLDPDAKDEGGELLVTTMRVPTQSIPVDCTIPLITVDMEVAVAESVDANPQMIVRVSKNGGKTFVTRAPITIGLWGQFNTRMILRNFGRFIRGNEFQLEFVVSDAVRVQYYGITAEPDLDGQ